MTEEDKTRIEAKAKLLDMWEGIKVLKDFEGTANNFWFAHPIGFISHLAKMGALDQTFNPYEGKTLSSPVGSINLWARTQSNIRYNPGFAPLTTDTENRIEYNGQYFGTSSGLYNVKRNTAVGIHTGVDFTTGMKKTEIKSFIYGKVWACTWDQSITEGDTKGYGKVMLIYNETDKKLYLLAHLSDYKKQVGETVSPGDTVAIAGTTGYSTGIHLHLEVFVNVSEKVIDIINTNACKEYPASGLAWKNNIKPTRVNPLDHTEEDKEWKGQ